MEQLPSYHELKTSLPLTTSQRSFIEKSRQTIHAILNGEDPRLLLVVGPCSIHDPHSAKEYAHNLKRLSALVSPHFYLVMRTYCEKARTGIGWKGFLYDPFLDGSHNITKGIFSTRKLLMELADLQVPAGTEFLDPLTAYYYDDLISWGSIGARTAYAQTHRQLASHLSMPVGVKNALGGSISSAVYGALVASRPQTYVGLNEDGGLSVLKSKGNPTAHIVLRGGDAGPNFDEKSVEEAINRLQQVRLPPRLLIDCSHQNSGKNHERQLEVFYAVLQQIAQGNLNIRGLLVESHLYEGNQPLIHPQQLQYGVSITDACLDWTRTKQLILTGCHILSNQESKKEEAAQVLCETP